MNLSPNDSGPSLDLALLEKVRHSGGKIIARCPACAEEGRDRHGDHLVILPSGKFACAAAQGDAAHRQRIFALVGIRSERPARDTPRDDRARRLHRLRQHGEERREHLRQYTAAGAARFRAHIIGRHPWDFADAWDDSPQRPEPGLETCPRRFLAALFPPSALIWAGETHHSGQEGRYAHCWRSVAEWLDAPDTACIGPMTTPAIWQPGSTSRTATQVREAPYTVLDFDGFDGCHPSTEEEIAAHLSASLAIIRWMREALRWRLAAILFTGHKSLHAWFHTPAPAVLNSLRDTALQLGLDPNLLGRPEHPCRLPGHPHGKTGRVSGVVWLGWAR